MLKIDATPDRLRLTGWFDAAQVPDAEAAFDALTGSCVVDMQELEYISSAGLGLLLRTQQRLVGDGHRIRLINMRSHIKNVFRCAGFDLIFDVE